MTAHGLHLHSWECFVVTLPAEWEFRQAPEAADAELLHAAAFIYYQDEAQENEP